MRNYLFIPLIVGSLIFTTLPNATAIKGGESALGDNRVVALVYGHTNNRSNCSGSLVTTRIVVSAAHCLPNWGTTYSSEVFVPNDLWISQPGADLNVDAISTRKKVVQVVLTNGYTQIFDRPSKNFAATADDIAFYLLESPLIENYSIEIASLAEVQALKANRTLIKHFGYGKQEVNSVDGKPYFLDLQATEFPGRSTKTTIDTQDIGTKSVCPGDSGGPWYSTLNGIQKIVAVTSTAGGCSNEFNGKGGVRGTVIAPYLPLLNRHLGELDSPRFNSDSASAIRAKITNPPRGWAAWINSMEYVRGPNPLVLDKVTTIAVRGVCNPKGQSVQVWKNTGPTGSKYSHGSKPLSAKWKCTKGVFRGEVPVTGITRMYLVELPASHNGTEIFFRPGLKIVESTLRDPEFGPIWTSS